MRWFSLPINIPAWARLGPRWVLSLWNHPYQDARLILEQNGDLQYLIIPARVQRIAARSALTSSAILFGILIVLLTSAFYLNSTKSQLEDSHRAIYAALLSGTSDLDVDSVGYLSNNDMLMLAQAIRERDRELRQIVSSVTSDLSIENTQLDQHLGSSGLTESAIRVIQNNATMGGFGRDLDTHPDPLLKGSFSEESARNRALKDVLMALPSQYPVTDYYISSRFGIRKHPVTGRPRFHAGIDLVTRSDDSVFPVKTGKVILARDYNDYGKTVIIRHERGIETLYAHLDKIHVREGQDVELDTLIGIVGNTGMSTGKHLHFEVTVGGYPVDPLKVINTAQNVQQAQR
jgi:murein DD-endopeptidase MepM/ murein hydrolase activator NlpD